MKANVLTTVLCLGASVLWAQENYSTWPAYKNLTLNTTPTGANLTGGVGRFPLLVRLTSANAGDVFSQAAAKGADIRFTKADGTTRLSHQRERWDTAGKLGEFWVLVDTVPGNTNTSIRMYWGKNGVGDSSNGSQVFSASNGFKAVWHLGDTSGVSPRPNSVTGVNAATPVNFPAGYAAKTGAIGLADSLRGGAAGSTSDYFDIGGGYTDFNGGFSYSVWAYPTNARAYSRIFEASSGTSGANNNIEFFRNNTTNDLTFEIRTGANSNGTTTAAGILTLNQWHHYQVTLNGTAVVIYHNGVQAQTGTISALAPVIARTAYMGRSFFTGDAYYQGTLDEAELSTTVRSAGWAKLSYETQKPGATALSFGATTVSIAVRKSTAGMKSMSRKSVLDVRGRATRNSDLKAR